MNREEKSKLAGVLKDQFSRAQVAIFADYKGLSATQADELRKLLRAQGAEVKVLKNNVARLVTHDGSLGESAKTLMNELVGPTLVAFAYGDPVVAAKVIHKFAQDNEAFTLKESLMGQKCVDVTGIETLAKLPSKQVLIAHFLSTMNAPITSFVGVLAAMPRQLVTVLAAIAKKKADPQT